MNKPVTQLQNWFDSGEPWVWLNAAAVSLSLMMVFGLLSLIAYNGLGYFWPADLMEAELIDGEQRTIIIGEIRETETVLAQQIREAGIQLSTQEEWVRRILLKQGNRDVYGQDFRWVLEQNIVSKHYPGDLLAIERREWGKLYGRLVNIKNKGLLIKTEALYLEMQSRLTQTRQLYKEVNELLKQDIGLVNSRLEKLRLKEKRIQLGTNPLASSLLKIEEERQLLNQQFNQYQTEVQALYEKMSFDSILVQIASGQIIEVPMENIIQVIKPNSMSILEKLGYYFHRIGLFISEDPREANTEGGIFPAIFGTVLMVILMSIMVMPLGVITAVYLHEYAHQGVMVRIIRIAVNNLAGVPSIVYGVFGLGFFVYFIGGSIDDLFYPEVSPAPVFGTPGLLWASMTLALLTLPVVIVTTEEGLSRIPLSIREGSLALGATKIETLWHTVLPMVSPAMMTGLILAVARAAGEVAPLMLVGVVKLAPALALDGDYPFLHLDRKFMHLGFHIYDVGFQSPNVEAATPLVYATALLLVLVIIILNLTAIIIRNRMREKYKELESH